MNLSKRQKQRNLFSSLQNPFEEGKNLGVETMHKELVNFRETCEAYKQMIGGFYQQN